MKSLMMLFTIALLAGCAQMGMHKRDNSMDRQSGSSASTPSSAAYGPSHSERDDSYHSWVN